MINDSIVFEDILAIVYVVSNESFEEIVEFVQEFIVVLLFLLPNSPNILHFYDKLLFCIAITPFDTFIQSSFVDLFDVEIELDDVFYSLGFSLLL